MAAMFDIGWQELFIVVVVGIIVIGPKELPRAARAIAGFVRKARMMAHEFQDGVDDMIQQADMDDIKKQFNETGDGLKNQIKDTVDLDLTEFVDDLDAEDKEDDDDIEIEIGEVEQISTQPDQADNKQDADVTSKAQPQEKG